MVRVRRIDVVLLGVVLSPLPPGAVARAAAATGFSASLRGRIAWAGGDGLAGASLDLRCQGDPPIARTVHTDREGAFRLDQLPAGPCRAIARAETFKPSEAVTFHLASGEQRRLDLVLDPEPPRQTRSLGYSEGLGDGLPLPARRLEAVIQLGGGLDGDRGPGGGVMGDGHFGAGYLVDGFDVGDPLSSGLGARVPEWGLVALSTGPGAFDPGASFSSGAATGLITRTGSNKFELSAQAGGAMATTGAGPGWLSDAGVLAAGPIIKDTMWFASTVVAQAGRTGPAGGTAASISDLTKLTWQMGPRNKLSLVTFGDQSRTDGRQLQASRLVGGRWEALLSDELVATTGLAWREGASGRGRFQGGEAMARVEWFLNDRFTDARLAVSARGSELDVDRDTLSPPGLLNRSIVRLDSNWRIRRYFTLELGAVWSLSRFREQGRTLIGGSGSRPAPLVALAWDATEDGRTAVRLSAAEVVDQGSVVTGEAALATVPAACRPSTREFGAGIEREVVLGTSLGLEGGIRQRPCPLPGDARASGFRHIGLHSRKREGRYRLDAHGQLEHAPADVRGRLRFDVTAALVPGLSVAATLAWDDRRAWAPLMDPFFEPAPASEPLPILDRGQTLVAGAQAWVAVGPVFGWPWALSTEAFAVGRQAMIRLRLVQGL